uniref:Uncharacterized protein n=1 Tax=Leersia perrieri TaxID=77586 RepID=A0A0D9XHI7_9ORYZ
MCHQDVIRVESLGSPSATPPAASLSRSNFDGAVVELTWEVDFSDFDLQRHRVHAPESVDFLRSPSISSPRATSVCAPRRLPPRSTSLGSGGDVLTRGGRWRRRCGTVLASWGWTARGPSDESRQAASVDASIPTHGGGQRPRTIGAAVKEGGSRRQLAPARLRACSGKEGKAKRHQQRPGVDVVPLGTIKIPIFN